MPRGHGFRKASSTAGLTIATIKNTVVEDSCQRFNINQPVFFQSSFFAVSARHLEGLRSFVRPVFHHLGCEEVAADDVVLVLVFYKGRMIQFKFFRKIECFDS